MQLSEMMYGWVTEIFQTSKLQPKNTISQNNYYWELVGKIVSSTSHAVIMWLGGSQYKNIDII